MNGWGMLAWGGLEALEAAVVASLALGVVSGLLGTFVVLRRESLFGDTLSHAVFPGIVTGFLVSGCMEVAGFGTGARNPVVILVCALGAGLLGALVVHLLQQTTRLKLDASLGIVLAVFFAVGPGSTRSGSRPGCRGFSTGRWRRSMSGIS